MRTLLRFEGVHHSALMSTRGQERATALLECAKKTGQQTVETYETEAHFLIVVNGKVRALIEKGEVLNGEIGSPVSLTVREDQRAWVSGRRPAKTVKAA